MKAPKRFCDSNEKTEIASMRFFREIENDIGKMPSLQPEV